jgi:hypothetical protein
MKATAAVLSLVACASLVRAQQPAVTIDSRADTPEALEAEIGTLKAAAVAWREIPWKTCLLEGLDESRASGKPVLLWIFIDRPTDDARC